MQGEYVAMHDRLMAIGGRKSRAQIMEIAEDLGLDVEQLEEDMDSDKATQVLAENSALAEKLGVNGTPNFAIGNRFIKGGLPFDMMAQIIEQEKAELD